MTPQTLGLIVGGLLPALLFGISGVLAKPATDAGIALGYYVIVLGLGVASVGLVIYLLQPPGLFSWRGSLFAALGGISWAMGAALVVLALSRYDAVMAQIVPLYNMNTLVAVVISLAMFAEWRDVNVAKLLAGALLITAGGALVANA